ncbi:MAG: DUF4115 domain-containing protein, partial [Rhodospirillaceae bacterium]|nr:DUF4115 domain-containing protein [Rhodospirillaceae bacterium]
AIVSRFKAETAELDDKTRLVFPSPMPEGRTPGGALILIAIIFAALVYGAWIYMSSQDRSLAEIVPVLPESLESLVETDTADATPDPVDATSDPVDATSGQGSVAPEKTPDVASSEQIAAPPNADQPSPVEKTKISPVPAKSTEGSSPPPVKVALEAPVAPVASIVKAPAKIEAPVVAKTPKDAAAIEAGAEVTTDGSNVNQEPSVRPVEARPVEARPVEARPVEESATVASKAKIPEKVARILETVEVPAANNPAIPTAAPTAALATVMPPTPPKDDATGPRRFGVENVASRITILAEVDSWVEVRDADESLLLTRLLKTGDSYKVPNRTGLKLHTGNAGGLRIEVDGIQAPGIGPVGAVRRDVALDADALKRGDANR